jgi:hypothetical protein
MSIYTIYKNVFFFFKFCALYAYVQYVRFIYLKPKLNSMVWVRRWLYRPSDRRLSAKWLPTFADRSLLFSIHIVVGVDDCSCFVIFPQSRLVVVCCRLCRLSMFIITSCFDKYSFCCFSFSYPILFLILFLLMVGESPCKSLLYCLQSQQIVLYFPKDGP